MRVNQEVNLIRKIFCMCLLLVIILTGCSRRIKPIKVTTTDFNIQEAEIIMKRAWQPVHDMTSSDYETRPNIKISSKEEFFNLYDFSFMDQSYMCDMIYENIATFKYDKEENVSKEIKDNEGYVVFTEGKYIPTIHDKGVFIKRAYLRESRYSKEHSYFDRVELVVDESSNEKISGYASGFSRKNIFMQNQEGEWILHSIEGHISTSWTRE